MAAHLPNRNIFDSFKDFQEAVSKIKDENISIASGRHFTVTLKGGKQTAMTMKQLVDQLELFTKLPEDKKPSTEAFNTVKTSLIGLDEKGNDKLSGSWNPIIRIAAFFGRLFEGTLSWNNDWHKNRLLKMNPPQSSASSSAAAAPVQVEEKKEAKVPLQKEQEAPARTQAQKEVQKEESIKFTDSAAAAPVQAEEKKEDKVPLQKEQEAPARIQAQKEVQKEENVLKSIGAELAAIEEKIQAPSAPTEAEQKIRLSKQEAIKEGEAAVKQLREELSKLKQACEEITEDRKSRLIIRHEKSLLGLQDQVEKLEADLKYLNGDIQLKEAEVELERQKLSLGENILSHKNELSKKEQEISQLKLQQTELKTKTKKAKEEHEKVEAQEKQQEAAKKAKEAAQDQALKEAQAKRLIEKRIDQALGSKEEVSKIQKSLQKAEAGYQEAVKAKDPLEMAKYNLLVCTHVLELQESQIAAASKLKGDDRFTLADVEDYIQKKTSEIDEFELREDVEAARQDLQKLEKTDAKVDITELKNKIVTLQKERTSLLSFMGGGIEGSNASLQQAVVKALFRDLANDLIVDLWQKLKQQPAPSEEAKDELFSALTLNILRDWDAFFPGTECTEDLLTNKAKINELKEEFSKKIYDTILRPRGFNYSEEAKNIMDKVAQAVIELHVNMRIAKPQIKIYFPTIGETSSPVKDKSSSDSGQITISRQLRPGLCSAKDGTIFQKAVIDSVYKGNQKPTERIPSSPVKEASKAKQTTALKALLNEPDLDLTSPDANSSVALQKEENRLQKIVNLLPAALPADLQIETKSLASINEKIDLVSKNIEELINKKIPETIQSQLLKNVALMPYDSSKIRNEFFEICFNSSTLSDSNIAARLQNALIECCVVKDTELEKDIGALGDQAETLLSMMRAHKPKLGFVEGKLGSEYNPDVHETKNSQKHGDIAISKVTQPGLTLAANDRTVLIQAGVETKYVAGT